MVGAFYLLGDASSLGCSATSYKFRHVDSSSFRLYTDWAGLARKFSGMTTAADGGFCKNDKVTQV